LDGTTAGVDDAMVREAATTENVAGDDDRRLYGNFFAGSTIGGRGYSCRGPREVICIVAGEDSADPERSSRRSSFISVSKSKLV
jgi:hypothetical protein